MERGLTPEYTEHQRAEFKEAYARLFRRHLIGIGLVFAAMMPLALSKDSDMYFGIPMSTLGPIALIALFLCFGVFLFRNWRCPACDEVLGRAFNPKTCRSCGVELR